MACAANHGLLYGWTRCPVCKRTVEPHLATGQLPTGLRGDDGPGRGKFTKRQTMKLLFLKWLWEKHLPEDVSYAKEDYDRDAAD